MRRSRLFALTALLTLTVLLVGVAPLATSAGAGAPPSPWDGSNPFNCTLQEAGFGPTGPDPAADPYCVHFDKTHQNVTQGGIAEFLSKEPARTAAASPKCFYFQSDHWRGSVVQSDGRSVVYEFRGHYFFNKATGDGGAWVTGFTLAGQTFDPTSIPGFPPQYGRYFGAGTGGFITHNDVPVDPACVALAKREHVYAPPARCVPGAGRVRRRVLGPVALGQREDSVRRELGPPRSVKRGFLRYCVGRGGGGGVLLIGERGDRSGTLGSGGRAPAVILATTSRGFLLGRHIRVGSHGRALRRALRRVHRLGRVGRRASAWRVRRGIAAVVARRRVIELVVYDPRAIRNWPALRGYLRRAA